MADELGLKGLNREVKEKDYEFADLIRENLGHDCGAKILELKEAADYTKRKIHTDLEAYEEELDSHRSCFRDLLEALDNMNIALEKNRLNRGELCELVREMKTEISNYY